MLFLWTARVALAIGAGGSKPLLALCFFPAEGLKGGFLVFLVLDFLDPLLPTACTSSSKTPFIQLKECQLVNNYNCKDSRSATEVTKFIVTTQGKNMVQKLYFIMHHLKKVLKLNGSPHIVS